MSLKDLIIEENPNFFAVNKPAGLVVNRAESVKSKTLADMVDTYLKIKVPKKLTTQSQKEFYEKSGIVHRLDKDTAGVILIAKNVKSYKQLKKLFLNKKITKTYIAVCFNDLDTLLNNNDYLLVDLPIMRNPKNRMRFGISKGGRKAKTKIYPLNEFLEKKVDHSAVIQGGIQFSALKVLPSTGRTHQIRVHTKALNMEILGDKLYGGRMQRKIGEKLNAPLMLFAYSLKFKAFKQNYELKAKPSVEFVAVFNKIFS